MLEDSLAAAQRPFPGYSLHVVSEGSRAISRAAHLRRTAAGAAVGAVFGAAAGGCAGAALGLWSW